jgi:hypothetical protein
MANNIWNNYTEKTATPVDADEVMVRDSTDGKNKRLLFGTFWKWVAKKLNEATISELQTSNKTIIGAINALNSDTSKSFVSLKESIKYSGDDSAFNIVSSDSTIYYRAVALNVAHPALLGSGGILIGYCFNRNYQRQIYYSSQIIATRTCYGGTWNSWERIK